MLQSNCSVASYMNMPFTMSETTYNDTVEDLLPIYKKVVENDINEAANSEITSGQETIGNDGINDITASFDGSWQRRGYASLRMG